MKLRIIAIPLIAVAITCPIALSAPADGDVDYQGNLALIPPVDPPASDPPRIIASLRGVHPRLLFTADEIETLRGRIETDELLKAAWEGKARWAARAGRLNGDPPDIVKGDGAALTTSVGRNPALAYVYALAPSDEVRASIVSILQTMLDEPYWADTAELDSNMGAANNMFMVAVLFDAVYNDLDDALRMKLARKILTHVRRMHYLGYRQKALMPIKYWQQDPANNHRWHRGAGMAACLLAIADIEGIDCDYILGEFRKEMDFLLSWYPADGDCHEGATYQRFGFYYLAAAAGMMDRVLGTQYLDHPGFRNAWAQQLYYWAPGRQGYMTFGDAPNNEGVINHLGMAFFVGPRLSRDKDVQAALLNFVRKQIMPKNGRQPNYPWTLLACYDPTVGEGDYRKLPTWRLFPDLGAASMRDRWDDDAVLFTFKCGPYGGYKLNEYAHAHPDEQGNPHYINVAHDDPDANSFALGFGGEFLFHPGNYATTKLTRTHNTLTVDGRGQLGEGEAYTQPVPGVDMRTLSYLTGWKVGPDDRIIIEGEAANAYEALKGFRRTAIWMPGDYILILDDVRADGERRITWRGTAEKAQFADPAAGRCYSYTKSGVRCDFQILSNRAFNGSIDYMLLGGRWSRLLTQQFQFFLDAESVRFACLLDPWKRNATLSFTDHGDEATVTVTGEGFSDVWTWRPSGDIITPSSIVGRRGEQELIALTETDVAPRGETH